MLSKNLETMVIPRKIIFGPKATAKLPETCRSMGFERLVVVSGPTYTAEIARRYVVKPLLDEGFSVESLVFSRDGSVVDQILGMKRRVGRVKGQVMVAVGGGSVVDAVKAAASLSGVSYISVPTSAANDGIASPATAYLLRVEVREKLGVSLSVEAPVAVVADTEIISRAPYRTIASGCGDLLAKFVAIKDWQLASKLRGEDYSEYAASLALMSANLIVEKAKYIKQGLEESVRIVVKALIGSGVAMSIAGSSRPASGSEHMFSHALDYLSRVKGFRNAPHGLQVGVGAIMMMWLHGGDWELIRDTLKVIGAPTNAYELGIDPKYVIEALTLAHRIRNRYTILGTQGLTREAAVRMAKETGVI